MAFKPNYTITTDLIKALMEIEAIRETIKYLPITPKIIKTLHESARLKSTHYSTVIEGNRLTEKETIEVINKNKEFPEKEHDEKEVKGYYLALEYIEKNAKNQITEETIKTIHAIVEGEGRKRVKPPPYRDGQNVIRDSSSGRIVYMPPEYKEVPVLMKDMEVCNSMLIYKDKEYTKSKNNDAQYIKAREKRDRQLFNRDTFKRQKYQEFHKNFKWQWECRENLYCIATYRGDVIAKQYNTDCFLNGKPCFVYEVERNMPELFEKYGGGSNIDSYLDSLNNEKYGIKYDLTNFDINYPYDKQFEAHLIEKFGQETVTKCNKIILDLDNKNMQIFFYRMRNNLL